MKVRLTKRESLTDKVNFTLRMENTTKANGMRVNAQATALVHNIIAWCVAARGAMGASKVNAWFTQPTAFTVLTSRVISMKRQRPKG